MLEADTTPLTIVSKEIVVSGMFFAIRGEASKSRAKQKIG